MSNDLHSFSTGLHAAEVTNIPDFLSLPTMDHGLGFGAMGGGGFTLLELCFPEGQLDPKMALQHISYVNQIFSLGAHF